MCSVCAFFFFLVAYHLVNTVPFVVLLGKGEGLNKEHFAMEEKS
jgi:hypothetical protein